MGGRNRQALRRRRVHLPLGRLGGPPRHVLLELGVVARVVRRLPAESAADQSRAAPRGGPSAIAPAALETHGDGVVVVARSDASPIMYSYAASIISPARPVSRRPSRTAPAGSLPAHRPK